MGNCTSLPEPRWYINLQIELNKERVSIRKKKYKDGHLHCKVFGSGQTELSTSKFIVQRYRLPITDLNIDDYSYKWSFKTKFLVEKIE